MTRLRDRVMSEGHVSVVHGLGYIGSSSAAFLRARGVGVVGIDPDESKVDRARAAICPVPALSSWLVAAGAPFCGIPAHLSLRDVIPPDLMVAVHHVCVPTEAEGAASNAALFACVDGIAAYDKTATVIVESTVAPPYLDEIESRHPGLRIAVAPRRDWFDAPDKHLGSLPRIVGADSQELLSEVAEYVGVVCDRVVPVLSTRTAALTKVVENAIRQIELAYGNELAVQIGDAYDVREILRLAATKWNIGDFRPSIGLGGYCIPLAPRYLQQIGVPLSMTDAAVSASAAHIKTVADFLARHERVDFWGASYKAGAPFSASSSVSAWLIDMLRKRGVRVRLFACDGYEEAWARRTIVELARWPDEVGGNALVIPVAHAHALALNDADARNTVGRYKMVLDNEDALRRVSPAVWAITGTDRRVPGQRGWLAP